MGVVVERMDLTVTGGADLNGGTGVLTLAFRLLTRNQVVFGESRHLSLAKFAGLRHRLEISAGWGTLTHQFDPSDRPPGLTLKPRSGHLHQVNFSEDCRLRVNLGGSAISFNRIAIASNMRLCWEGCDRSRET
jgi:hypothetical protein